MRYYLVTAKCGHVGKGKYYEVDFPIFAECKSAAAQICLRKPKVKRHLRNAISKTVEISYEEYERKLIELKNNPFVKAHTKKEILVYREHAEIMNFNEKERKRSFGSRAERISYVLKKNRLQEEYYYA